MICLSFDVEERFHSHLTAADAPHNWRLHDHISRLIDYLTERKISATFFVVGELAEKYPDLVRRMSGSGLEVAAHGYQHQHLGRISVQDAKKEIAHSKSVLEDINGQAVIGFRAPSWSVQQGDDWFWDYLQEKGFLYDSSLFPFYSGLYGSCSNPTTPFQIRPGLLEIPPSVFRYGPVRIPYGGGFYFRLYPCSLTEWFLKRDIRAAKIPVVYFHPWEFEPAAQPTEKGIVNRMIGNVNIRSNWTKFTTLLDHFKCQSLGEYCDRLRDMAEQVRTR